MFYNRGEVISDQFDNLKVIWIRVSVVLYWGKKRQKQDYLGIFPWEIPDLSNILKKNTWSLEYVKENTWSIKYFKENTWSKKEQVGLSIHRINPLWCGIFYQRNTLYDLCVEIWGMMRHHPPHTYNAHPPPSDFFDINL